MFYIFTISETEVIKEKAKPAPEKKGVIYSLHLHLVILWMLLSKATYNWGVHKAINLEEANIQRKCS